MDTPLQQGRTRGNGLPPQRWTPPPFCPEERESLVEIVKEEEPVDYELPGHGWTLKKLRLWVERKLGRSVSRSTLRSLLKAAGMSWKKCKKLLARANPERRAAYVQEFQCWFERMVQGDVVLIYVDEVHIHQDMDLGYTWGTVGEPLWRKSTSPGLDHRINWYGAYDFTHGRCLLWENGYCKGDNTIEFLRLLLHSFSTPDQQLVVIWDGASHHRSKTVKAEAERLGILLLPLPGYSPDLNPIEGLWKWLREEVTQHFCHPTLQALRQACLAFIERINQNPLQLISRLWPTFDLDPDYEKLLVSN